MMSRKTHRILIRFSVALGFMLLLGACDIMPDSGGGIPAGFWSSSDELVTFVQDFAREAMAALLY